MPEAVVFLRPLSLEQGFRFSIALLLFPVRQHGITPVVPHDGGWTKPQGPSLFLQPPTNIDVITRDPILRVETTDGREGFPAKGHVAAGNVLRDRIRQKHVDWPAGCIRHAGFDITTVPRW